MASLYKIHPDGSREFKEQGQRIESIQWKEDGTFDKVVGSLPTVGCSMLVGSITARTYSNQDYWLTTKVTEILEERKTDDGLYEYVRFRTENSEYEITI
jgi:hypothetical protein